MNTDDLTREPDEHVRFASYLAELQAVAEADELTVVSRVLGDPDPVMAQSAVLRYVDRRAGELQDAPGYEAWAEAMTRAVADRALLVRRLQEWALYRAVALGLVWRAEELLAASDWLQLRTAAGASTAALELLARDGRTKRIRTAASQGLRRR